MQSAAVLRGVGGHVARRRFDDGPGRASALAAVGDRDLPADGDPESVVGRSRLGAGTVLPRTSVRLAA